MAMRDHRTLATRDDGTEVIDPYEPPEDPAYDWEYDDEPAYRGTSRILWGRLVVLGVVVLLAFLVGRATGGGGGIPQEDFDAMRAERNDAQAEAQQLQGEVEDYETQNQALQDSLDAANADTTTPDTTGDDTTTTEDPGETYVVREGDTLRDIALQFYDDATLDDYIAEANGIEDPSLISAGTELTIPPDPSP